VWLPRETDELIRQSSGKVLVEKAPVVQDVSSSTENLGAAASFGALQFVVSSEESFQTYWVLDTFPPYYYPDIIIADLGGYLTVGVSWSPITRQYTDIKNYQALSV